MRKVSPLKAPDSRAESTEELTHVSLFSGIGGIDLAAEWAGFKTVAFVERDPFCQKVLAKHWPEVPIYDDVTTFDGRGFSGVDLVSAGFPCQNISQAQAVSEAEGIDGALSSLWFSGLQVIAAIRPRWALVENVYHLKSRGLDRIVSSMEQEGFTVWPIVLGAGNAGAPHIRKRFFLVIHTNRNSKPTLPIDGKAQRMVGPSARAQWGVTPSNLRGMDDGIPNRVDRLRSLGNAVVPQQVFPILNAIAEQIRGGNHG